MIPDPFLVRGLGLATKLASTVMESWTEGLGVKLTKLTWNAIRHAAPECHVQLHPKYGHDLSDYCALLGDCMAREFFSCSWK